MQSKKNVICPDCGEDVEVFEPSRRKFIKTATAAATGLWAVPTAEAKPTPNSAAETAVKALYDTLTDEQKKQVCFEWDYKDREPDPKKNRGILRTHVSNNWHITKPTIDSNFFTKDQKDLIFKVYKGIFNPDWHERLMKQLKDDTNGRPWGADQNIAIFGKPGDKDRFEFVMTGRHLTCRADGGSTSSVALGGPIFHGHAA